MTHLENVGIVFACCLRIESRIKDFILIKENPEFIESINKSTTEFDKEINIKINELQQISFNSTIIDKFLSLYQNELIGLYKGREAFDAIVAVRDCIGHGYFRRNAHRLFHMPKSFLRDKRVKALKILVKDSEKNNPISINLDDKYVDGVMFTTERFDKNLFPALCEKMGLNYQKIR